MVKLYIKKLEQQNYQNKYKMMKKFFIIFIFYIFAQSASAADKQTSELNNLFAELLKKC